MMMDNWQMEELFKESKQLTQGNVNLEKLHKEHGLLLGI